MSIYDIWVNFLTLLFGADNILNDIILEWCVRIGAIVLAVGFVVWFCNLLYKALTGQLFKL